MFIQNAMYFLQYQKKMFTVVLLKSLRKFVMTHQICSQDAWSVAIYYEKTCCIVMDFLLYSKNVVFTLV